MMITVTALGRMWRHKMRDELIPIVIAAPTKSSCRSSRTRPRTSRATGGTKLTVIATMSPVTLAPTADAIGHREDEARNREQKIDEARL